MKLLYILNFEYAISPYIDKDATNIWDDCLCLSFEAERLSALSVTGKLDGTNETLMPFL